MLFYRKAQFLEFTWGEITKNFLAFVCIERAIYKLLSYAKLQLN